MRYALDTSALIDYLDDVEPAGSRVSAVLEEERPLMSWINLGEAGYILERRLGRYEARRVVREAAGQLTLDVPTPERILEAAGIKAQHPMSYADAFAVATALAHRATLLTSDPEILRGDPAWATEDLRPT